MGTTTGRGRDRRGRTDRTWLRPAVGLGLTAFWLGATSAEVRAQIPDEFTNLQHFPADISRDALIDEMRSISLSLGVRCQSCHVGSADGVSFEGVDFASDESPLKRAARDMLAMMGRINGSVAALPDRGEPRESVTCKTCHRGAARPQLLSQFLASRLEQDGPGALVQAYADAREQLEWGRFDFREWELNLWAEELAEAGRLEDAIAVYEVNRTAHPESSAVLSSLGPLYEQVGRVEDAIAVYESFLELQPGNAQVQARLNALRGR